MSAPSSAFAETLSNSQTEVLLNVLRVLGAYSDPVELFRALAETLREVIDLSSLGVLLYDENNGSVRLYAHEAFGRPLSPPDPPMAVEDTLMYHVYARQEPFVVDNADTETQFPAVMHWLRQHEIRSNCTLPLSTASRRLGALGVSSRNPYAYSAEDVALLSIVAGQVALAVGDAVNLEASRVAQAESLKMFEQLKLVLDVNNSVASNLELRELLRSISASIRQIMNSDLVGVALPDPDGKHLRLSAFDFPESKGFLREESITVIEGTFLGEVFRTRRPFVTGLHHSVIMKRDEDNPEGLRCCCIVPLVCRDRVLGVLCLARRDERHYTTEDLHFVTQMATQVAIAVENALAYGEIAGLKEQLSQEKLYLEDEIRSEMNFQEVVGQSTAIRRVLHEAETVAPSDSSVLILGETGTGKELIARAIHNLGQRRKNAFIKLNCAAIPTGLLESELFGHEKGAFTGAIAQHTGRFELAHHGTMFLDEIGDIPLELQPKLLRVLQEREFERLGSTRTLRSDARVIAATNRDLSSMVDEGKFRADLFYRLNVFPIYIPPLRERQTDIPPLVRHFAQQFARRMNKRIETIPSETMKALVNYHWPGNIRELQNVVERAVILTNGPALRVTLSELKAKQPAAEPKSRATVPVPRTPIRGVLAETERNEIQKALEESGWIVAGPNGAAARLGMKRSTLQFRMQKLGLTRDGHRAS
jgi:formate hydrogenlyase transcriptional activator